MQVAGQSGRGGKVTSMMGRKELGEVSGPGPWTGAGRPVPPGPRVLFVHLITGMGRPPVTEHSSFLGRPSEAPKTRRNKESGLGQSGGPASLGPLTPSQSLTLIRHTGCPKSAGECPLGALVLEALQKGTQTPVSVVLRDVKGH